MKSRGQIVSKKAMRVMRKPYKQKFGFKNPSYKFLFLWGCGFFLFSFYPVSILFVLKDSGLEVCGKWIQNDPAFTIYPIFFISLAFAIFSVTFNPAMFRLASKPLKGYISFLLVCLLTLASFLVYHDFFDTKKVGNICDKSIYFKNKSLPKLPKFTLLDLNEFIRSDNNFTKYHQFLEERKNGTAIEAKFSSYLKNSEESLDFSDLSLRGKETVKFLNYLENSEEFLDFSDLSLRGTKIAYAGLSLNWIAGIFAAVFVWYFISIIAIRVFSRGDGKVVVKQLITQRIWNNIWIIFILLIFWIPIRLYSSWYINFFKMPDLKAYFAFVTLLIVALIIGFFLVLNTIKTKRAKITFGGISGLLASVVAIIGLLEPEHKWLTKFFSSLSKLPFFPEYCLVLFVFLNVSVLTVLYMLKSNLSINTQENRTNG